MLRYVIATLVLASSASLVEAEVTVAAYRACVQAGKCTVPQKPTNPRDHYCSYAVAGRDGHPVNCVDWAQANAYCAWRGKRLPWEPEREKAARAGSTERTAPTSWARVRRTRSACTTCWGFAVRAHPDHEVGITALRVSARTGEGLDGWYRWICKQTITAREAAL